MQREVARGSCAASYAASSAPFLKTRYGGVLRFAASTPKFALLWYYSFIVFLVTKSEWKSEVGMWMNVIRIRNSHNDYFDCFSSSQFGEVLQRWEMCWNSWLLKVLTSNRVRTSGYVMSILSPFGVRPKFSVMENAFSRKSRRIFSLGKTLLT